MIKIISIVNMLSDIELQKQEGNPVFKPRFSEKNTKIFALIFVGVATFLAGVFFYFFTLEKMGDLEERSALQPVKQESVEKKACIYGDDASASKVAHETNDLKICLCIKDEALRNLCEENIRDSLTYKSALKQLDVRMCDSLIVEARKEGCIAVIENSIAYFEKEDPKRLATIFSMSHHNDKAILQYEELLESDPNNIEYLKNVALAYAEKGLKEQEFGRDQTPFVEKALATIEKAKSINENDSDIYRVMGYVYEIQPNLSTALTWYEKAIELDPTNIAAYAGKGHVNRMLGFLELAVFDFEKAAELDVGNTYPYIYANLCTLEYSRGNTEASEKNCNLVLANEQENSITKTDALRILSSIALSKGEYSVARSYLQTALTITPNDSALYIDISKTNLYVEEYENAEIAARKAVELSPHKAVARLALAQALYMLEEFEESIEEAQKGIGLVENDVSLLTPSKPSVLKELYAQLSFNYRELGNTEKQDEYQKLAEKIKY